MTLDENEYYHRPLSALTIINTQKPLNIIICYYLFLREIHGFRGTLVKKKTTDHK